MRKDWKQVDLDESDKRRFVVARFYNAKNGKPPFTESIELKQFKDGREYDYHLVGGYWDSIFKTKKEALDYAEAYMRRK